VAGELISRENTTAPAFRRKQHYSRSLPDRSVEVCFRGVIKPLSALADASSLPFSDSTGKPDLAGVVADLIAVCPSVRLADTLGTSLEKVAAEARKRVGKEPGKPPERKPLS
jgi:hypothetical protein